MPSLGCWCLAPESTLRHLWTSQNVRRRSVVGSGKGVRCACGGDACAYRLVGCWDVARGLLERAILLFSIVDMTSVNGALPSDRCASRAKPTQEFFSAAKVKQVRHMARDGRRAPSPAPAAADLRIVYRPMALRSPA
eukprot:scaffold5016_cov118-Isochrysis_galbana.AAC.10